jgi:hypothetical protein
VTEVSQRQTPLPERRHAGRNAAGQQTVFCIGRFRCHLSPNSPRSSHKLLTKWRGSVPMSRAWEGAGRGYGSGYQGSKARSVFAAMAVASSSSVTSFTAAIARTVIGTR